MKIHLERILMIVGFFCLTNTFFAQSLVGDNESDDFFEFVVVEQSTPPVEVVEPDSLEAVTDEFIPVENDTASEETVGDESQEASEDTSSSATVTDASSDVVEELSLKTNLTDTASPSEALPSETDVTLIGEASAVIDSAPVEAAADKLSGEPESSDGVINTETIIAEPKPEENSSPAADNTSEASSSETPENAETEPVQEEEPPVDDKAPSRSVEMKKKEYLDVEYPGEGWLYMGDENGSKVLTFKGREQKGSTTIFKFYAVRKGDALLKFSKHDILTDTDIYDYLLVSVINKSGNKQHIKAPEYVPAQAEYPEEDEELVEEDLSDMEQEENPVEDSEAEEPSEEQEEEPVEGVEEPLVEDIVVESGISLSDEPDVVFSFGEGIDFFGSDSSDDDYYQQLIDEANDAFFSGNGQEAVDKAQIVIDDGSYFSDEAYYIQAQVYETNEELLDVNKAYELYKTIVDYYPESAFWTKASKRVTYLDRYYYSIR
ncbi:MAG: hypothetical protein K5930_00030 [Treponemataceae bacterium]|nr:hypothetical protein [Treponemataceae bacterium]